MAGVGGVSGRKAAEVASGGPKANETVMSGSAIRN